MLLRNSAHGASLSNSRRQGFVIVAVLLVVAVLTLAAYQYSTLMDAEFMAAERIRKANEARVLADSGVHYACALLADPDAFSGTLNENPFDNAKSFQAVLVKEGTARSQGRFSLIAPDYTQVSATGSVTMRFGMIDETSKLNINSLFAADSTGQVLHDALMKLPNMTDDFAWSIVDWIDPNDEPSPGGAESQYYSSLTPPYQCKNAPLDTIEELLLVKGITPALLYGSDLNRNGKIDPGEDDGLGFTVGWSAYLTVYSRERNVDSDGKKRVNINGDDLATLNTDLTAAVGADLTNFILAYRLYGGTSPTSTPSTPSTPAKSRTATTASREVAFQAPPNGGNNNSGGGNNNSGGGNNNSGGGNTTQTRQGTTAELQSLIQKDLQSSKKARQRVSSLFSLLGATVTIPSQDRRQPSLIFKSPLTADSAAAIMLGDLLDKCTTSAESELPARVNVNTAPREVLMALPGMTDVDADAIIAKRPAYLNGEAPDTSFATVAWLLSSGGLKPNVLQSLERYVTARTQVYRVISVGYFDEAGPIARVEAIIDVNQGKPRIAYYRNLTDQGRAVDPRLVSQ